MTRGMFVRRQKIFGAVFYLGLLFWAVGLLFIAFLSIGAFSVTPRTRFSIGITIASLIALGAYLFSLIPLASLLQRAFRLVCPKCGKGLRSAAETGKCRCCGQQIID